MDLNPPTPNVPGGSGIEEDHVLMQQTLHRLGSAADIEQTIHTLHELRELLERHFIEEEAEDGLAASVGESAPQLVARVQTLLGQHQGFLDTIASIVQRAEALQKSSADLQIAVRQLIHDLDEHEKAETRLLVDSVYNDIGPSD